MNRRKEEILLFCITVSGINAAVAACMGDGFLTAVGCIATIAAAETYRTGLKLNKRRNHDTTETN